MTPGNHNILPDPDTLTVHVHVQRDGCTFEIRSSIGNGRESIYDDPTPATSPRTAQQRGQLWITRYRQADARERCRMCGYSWAAVSRALTREAREAAQA